jgi:hypothetical protein
MIPTFIISGWLFGLLSFGLIGGGVYLTREWYRRAWVYDPQIDRWIFNPQLGFNVPTALLVAGIALFVWAIAGGVIVRWAAGLLGRSGTGSDHPQHTREGEVHRLLGFCLARRARAQAFSQIPGSARTLHTTRSQLERIG